MAIIYKIIIILYFISIINCKLNVDLMLNKLSLSKSVKTVNDAMGYLNKFGYMEIKNETVDMKPSKMKSSITHFQRFMGLSETGHLDKETMDMMNMPRCGVADNLSSQTNRVYSSDHKRRFRRYQLQGSVWEVKNITWKVTKYSSRDNLRGKDRDIDNIMKHALNEWSQYTQLNFVHEKGNNKPMIEIAFRIRDHRDGNSFDGPGRTLAHAFFPQFGGATHFDDEESWAIDGGRGVDLLSVAVHEFGHALGLGHSDNKESLMYPTYAGKRYKLKSDDITGIEMLYGKKMSHNDEPTYLDRNENWKPNVRSKAPDLCQDFQIDAADCNTKGECFFFRDNFIWRINNDTSVYPGYPKLISDIFPGVSGKIDAVVTDQSNGHTYIFKKDRVWTYSGPMKKALTSNLAISDSIRGLLASNFDAATPWGFNGKTYLFKDDNYWRYDSDRKRPISKRYPQSLGVWHGLPPNIDAAMFWPRTGKTYFFKGPYYYRFNDYTSSVDDASPSFPREASKWWLKCRSNNIVNDNIKDNEIDSNIFEKCEHKKVCDKNINNNESNDPTAKDDLKFVNFFKSRYPLARLVSVMKKFAKLLVRN